MVASVTGSVIRKKIESARNVNSPVPRVGDVLSGLTKHIEQNVRAYLGTIVETMILDVETKRFSSVLDAISMPAMIGIVAVEGVDRSAIVDLDLDLVYHVVDLRMGGSPAELPEFAARRPTAIDNAMCRPLVDIVLDGLALSLRDAYAATECVDLRCSTFEHMPMSANIVDERADALCVTVSLDIGEAARSGNLQLVLPFSMLDIVQARMKKTQSLYADASSDIWAGHMLNVVLDTEVELTPSLHSAQFSVAEIARLEVGAVLPLEIGAHQGVELKLDLGEQETTVAKGRLGVLKGRKAIKLAQAPDPEFLAPLRALVMDAERA